MPKKNGVSYKVSRNGSADDWYWEVISDRNIIARGLAPTSAQARAQAISSSFRQLKELWGKRRYLVRMALSYLMAVGAANFSHARIR